MELHVPHYYDKFVCIADKCIDNCCFGGWEINIDGETVHYYQSLNSPFGKEIIDNLDYTDEYCFKLKDGHCPFLDKHNLCMIYKNLGENHLGVVCAQFPRYTEYYGNIKETGIGLACEEAAQIIFKDASPFLLKTTIIEEPADTSSEYDKEWGTFLFNIRNFFFDLLNKNQYNLNDKLIIIIHIASEIQEYINHNDTSHLKALYETLINDANIFEKYINKNCMSNDTKKIKNNENYSNTIKTKNCIINIEDCMYKIWTIYLELESINKEWDMTKNNVIQLLHSDNKKNYIDILNQYHTYILNHTAIKYDNLIKYYIYRYFMKAAYDYNVLGKIQLAISNYLIVKELDMTQFIKNNFSFSFQDQMDTVHIFSREIEYSEDNIEQLYEEFVFDNIFKAENLTKLLSIL